MNGRRRGRPRWWVLAAVLAALVAGGVVAVVAVTTVSGTRETTVCGALHDLEGEVGSGNQERLQELSTQLREVSGADANQYVKGTLAAIDSLVRGLSDDAEPEPELVETATAAISLALERTECG